MTFNGRSGEKKCAKKKYKSQRTYTDGTFIGRNQDDPTARFTIPDSLYFFPFFSHCICCRRRRRCRSRRRLRRRPVDDESCNQKVIIQVCLRLRELSRCRPQFLGVPGIETMRNERQWYYFVLISLLGAMGSYPSCPFLLSGETSTDDSSPLISPSSCRPHCWRVCLHFPVFPRPILYHTFTRTGYSIFDA